MPRKAKISHGMRAPLPIASVLGHRGGIARLINRAPTSLASSAGVQRCQRIQARWPKIALNQRAAANCAAIALMSALSPI